MKWLAYFHNIQKQRALSVSCKNDPLMLDYGTVIYKSGCFLGRRWLVTDFYGEYEVFVELEKQPRENDRRFAAAFANKDRAVAFASEMFLVCCGKLRRRYKECDLMLPGQSL